MKFNIEVEVDWIGEEGNIDEVIKKEISDHVVNTITCLKTILKGAANVSYKILLRRSNR